MPRRKPPHDPDALPPLVARGAAAPAHPAVRPRERRPDPARAGHRGGTRIRGLENPRRRDPPRHARLRGRRRSGHHLRRGSGAAARGGGARLRPDPRAIGHGRALEARLPGFHFHPVGLWKEDAEIVFHAPADPRHVSHSITGLHGQNPGFKGLCRRVRTLMNELGHDTIDLLKMDIEGAEYEVLADLLDSAIPVRAVCVEFDETHSARDGAWRDRIAAMTARMIRAGFDLVAVQPKGNYTFLRREA
ncbi:MAG: FkbM family methyltransferase [Kiritimatiellia bacterium]